MKKSHILTAFTASAFMLFSMSSMSQRTERMNGGGSRPFPGGGRPMNSQFNSPRPQQQPRPQPQPRPQQSSVYNGPYKPQVSPQRPPVSNYSAARVRSPYQQSRVYGSNYSNRGGRFYYNGGYHPRPVYYRPFPRPSFGVRINVLPAGYYPFQYRRHNYYYSNGIFYQPYGGYYQTIAPPLGAVILTLPPGAYFSTINNIGYYEYQGTYYQPYPSGGYEVAGVNGYLGADLNAANSSSSDDGDIISDQSIGLGSSPQQFTTLPSDYKTVTLNGINYYVSPSGEYYTKNIDAAGKVTYQLSAAQN